jgi:hypothetical protein
VAEGRDQKNPSEHSPPTDAGRTSGGGSLGHKQPPDVEEQTNTRNNTGSRNDPVMPADDATLKTRI